MAVSYGCQNATGSPPESGTNVSSATWSTAGSAPLVYPYLHTPFGFLANEKSAPRSKTSAPSGSPPPVSCAALPSAIAWASSPTVPPGGPPSTRRALEGCDAQAVHIADAPRAAMRDAAPSAFTSECLGGAQTPYPGNY